MKLSHLKESIEIQLDQNQTLLVNFTDEGIVFDVWDQRIRAEPVLTSWKFYSEFMVDVEDDIDAEP